LIIDKINKGGSKRNFFRIEYNKKKAIRIDFFSIKELNKYLIIQNLIKKNDIPVPKIFEVIKNELRVIVEDGGNISVRDIVKLNKENYKFIFELYKGILKYLIKLQSIHLNINLPYFSEYRIEKDILYFEDMYYTFLNRKFIKNYGKIKNKLYKFNKLKKISNTLLYRDFQSENILWNRGYLMFVDFQDMMVGPPIFDLASLIEDPYVDLPQTIKSKLIYYYFINAYSSHRFDNYKEFIYFYNISSLLRLIQAIAAFINLGIVQKNSWFIQFISITEVKIDKLIYDLI